MNEGELSTRVVWVVRAGRKGLHADEFERHRIAGIALPSVGSIAEIRKADVRRRVVAQLQAEQPSKAPGYAFMLYRFAHEIAVGHLIVTPDAVHRSLLFGRILGPYEFSEAPPVKGYHHFRSVDWLGRRRRDEVPRAVLPTLGAPMAVFMPAAQVALLDLDVWEETSNT